MEKLRTEELSIVGDRERFFSILMKEENGGFSEKEVEYILGKLDDKEKYHVIITSAYEQFFFDHTVVKYSENSHISKGHDGLRESAMKIIGEDLKLGYHHESSILGDSGLMKHNEDHLESEFNYHSKYVIAKEGYAWHKWKGDPSNYDARHIFELIVYVPF